MKHTGGEYHNLHAGLGAKGYDVVAYLRDGAAVPGSEQHATEHGGATWRFASREHLEAFRSDPTRYAPQFGGYCAWGVAQGRLFDVDPVHGWTVHDGKLYLNFNADINATFRSDAPAFIGKASRNWPALNR